MEAQSLELLICNTENFVNKDDTDYHMVVRPLTDIKAYQKQCLAPVIAGTEKEPVLNFQKLVSGKKPKIQRPNPIIGYPICLPKSTQPLPNGPLSWWHNIIIRQQCLAEMFMEGAGIVLELYESRILGK